MFSGEIESAGKTNSPKNVPDPVLRWVGLRIVRGKRLSEFP